MEPRDAGAAPPPMRPNTPRIVHGPLGDEPQSVIRRALAVLIALGCLGLDLAWPGTITGMLAEFAMFGLFIGLLAGMLRSRSMRVRRLASALVGADAIILLTLFAMFIARGYILSQQFGGPSDEYDKAARIYDVVFLIIGALQGFSAAMPERLVRLALKLAQRPAMMLASSFAAMILVGTLMLTLPVSVENVSYVSFVDSLFTVTSAVCVTGLTVNDPGLSYTFFGEFTILLSIQLGGIGIMTLAALTLAFARDTALATQLRYAAMLDARTLTDLRTTVQSIVVGTLAIEAVGALLLYLQFDGDPRVQGSALWLAVFHAVSAFCNAGFALFPGNLTPFADDFGVQGVIMVLVIFGGIGFPVMRELVLLVRLRVAHRLTRGRPDQVAVPLMSLATRVVLWTSAALILVGMAITLAVEWRKGFVHLSVPQRFLAALFHSVCTRTAGFNTVDVGAMAMPTLLWTCVLMFIGGSPGSTAGGIKTTTFATLLATLRAELRGHEPVLGNRAIAPEVFRRATAVVSISAAIVLVAVTLLSFTEEHDFMKLLFESVSAFATVGLSTGITGSLTAFGKLVIVATMFIGRCGPLTVALAVASAEHSKPPYRLARESLPIG
ncbi:MAG: TrkH family potassium uptake protein [Deltaproteobacteria bacterium]|nr:TrkH family potassium uptake protein [Deltaproteobacteria bacterium]MBK8714411.1 TrkH family potassium uptake protein [Deltaproteobacteria bacterium]